MIRMFLTAAMASACVVGCASIATAQGSYPEKPLQLIVPFPAGGASDVVGRIIAGELETRLGKPVIVNNRPGGGTTIAAKEVAIAAPDGYTLFSSSNSTFTLQNAVKENVPYDSAKDFEPIAQTGTITMVLVPIATIRSRTLRRWSRRRKPIPTSCRWLPLAWRPFRILPASCSNRAPASRWCTCPTGAARRR